MKILQPIVSELLYLTIISFIFLVRITPRPIAITVGRLLGLAFWALVPYYRKLVKIQMKNVLGSGYSRLLPIKAFMNFGMIPVEIIKKGLDFREFVFRQAKGIKQAFKSQG